MSDPIIYIYADESCLGNQFQDRDRPGAAAGLVERFDDRRGWHRRDFAYYESDTTNNRMALYSAIVGLRHLQRPCSVVFTSDSQYLVRGMREWLAGWVRRGWKRKGGAIENLDLWRAALLEAQRHQVEWRWTRGHADDVKNEYADALATDTAATGNAVKGLVESGFEEWLGGQRGRGRYEDFLDLPPTGPFRPDPLPTGG